jgi:hypothetical protein
VDSVIPRASEQAELGSIGVTASLKFVGESSVGVYVGAWVDTVPDFRPRVNCGSKLEALLAYFVFKRQISPE